LVGAILSILYLWTAFVMWKFLQWANAWRKGASSTLTPATAVAKPAVDASSAETKPATPPAADNQSEEKK